MYVMDWMSSIYQVMASIFGTAWNAKMQRETNENNRMLVDMQNKAAALESEKAYRRSMPSMQMGQMRAAGLSDSAAAQAISGGATYQPAPVNVSQEEAPQIDLSQAIQAVTSSMQMRNERKMQEKMLAAQAAESAANRENAKEIALINADASKYGADTGAKTAGDRLAFDREQFEYNKPKILAEINNIVQNTDNLKKIGKGYELDNIRKQLENSNFPTMAKLANAHSWQQLEYVAMKLAHENAEHMNKQERENLELEFYRATMDAGINLQNVQNELQAYLSQQELNMYKDGQFGTFVGALSYVMNNLAPKFALFK